MLTHVPSRIKNWFSLFPFSLFFFFSVGHMRRDAMAR
jgi:hypothetical protein